MPPGFLRPGEELVPDFRLWLRGLNKKQLPKDVDPKLLQELMKKLPEDQRANKKDIEQLLEKNPQFKDPAFLKQLGEMVQSDDFPKNLEEKLPKDGPPIPNEQPLKENLEKVVEEGIKHAKAPEGGPKGDQPDLPKVDSSTFDLSKHDPKTANPASENDWAKWLEKNFSDSPAGQAALKDLMSALEKQDMKGMFDQVPEFKNGAWKDLDTWGKSNAPDLWKVKPPDLSGNKVTSPKIGGSGGPSWGGGGGGGGSSGFGGGGGTDLAGGAPRCRDRRNRRGGPAGRVAPAAVEAETGRAPAAHLAGRPGIDFDSIRTREELVQAFDHVSLDQIGEKRAVGITGSSRTSSPAPPRPGRAGGRTGRPLRAGPVRPARRGPDHRGSSPTPAATCAPSRGCRRDASPLRRRPQRPRPDRPRGGTGPPPAPRIRGLQIRPTHERPEGGPGECRSGNPERPDRQRDHCPWRHGEPPHGRPQ